MAQVEKPPARRAARAHKPKKTGRPTLWRTIPCTAPDCPVTLEAKRQGKKRSRHGHSLESKIIDVLITTGCSFRDAAEMCGITYDTLKERQRSDAPFSTRLARARLVRKTKTLGKLMEAADGGSVQAMTWWLERVYTDEFGPPRRLEISANPGGSGGGNVNFNFATIIADPGRRREIDDLLGEVSNAEKLALGRGTGAPEPGVARPVRLEAPRSEPADPSAPPPDN